jgi:hypothetical protein
VNPWSSVRVLVVAAAACGRDPVAPPGSEGRLDGAWTGTVTFEGMMVPVALWIEEDVPAGGLAAVAMQLQSPFVSSLPLSADDAEPCVVPERTSAVGTLGYRMATDLGADIEFAVSLDGATHNLVGQWAADSNVIDAGGDIVLRRVGWFAARSRAVVIDGRSVEILDHLGCVTRPAPQCADGVDNDGDGRTDAADPACCNARAGRCPLIGNREDDEPSCANALDDDGDGAADAADPECRATIGGKEIGDDPPCGDGWDNDGDGAIDLADAGCLGDDTGVTEVAPMCGDGDDNDGDGDTDGDDADCVSGDVEAMPDIGCSNGYDDDGDGAIDTGDPSCHDQPGRPQESAVTTCDDGIDNDGDGLVDLDEPECSRTFFTTETGEIGATDCEDGADNDGDGATDLDDTNCFWFGDGVEVGELAVPVPRSALGTCDDGLDDDGDGRTDRADPDCAVIDPAVRDVYGGDLRFEDVASCHDGLDGDGDGLVDSGDPDCASLFAPSELPGCSNGRDDDSDGLVDLDDPTCAGDPSRAELARQCADGQDNDADGAIDGDDAHCTAAHDWSEADACSDGRDNDNDGRFDLADPDCTGAGDDDER